MYRRLASWIGLAIVLAKLAGPAWAADVRWRTGTAFSQRLDAPVGAGGVQWSGRGMRDALTTLSRATGVETAVMIDRRIDPGQPLELTIAGTATLAEAYGQIARKVGAGSCLAGPVVYFGPPGTTHRLRTVIELRKDELGKFPGGVASRLRRAKAWKWDDLVTPRELVEELAAEAGWTIDGLERIPHDLWGGNDLPAMTLVERLSLILAGYDLTFEVTEPAGTTAKLRLVPTPAQVTLKRLYVFPAGQDKLIQKLIKQCPDARIEAGILEGGKSALVVDGLAEDQAVFADALRGNTTKKPPAAGPVNLANVRSKFTAKNQPAGELLNDVAVRLQLEIRVDEEKLAAAGLSMTTLVSAELTNATVHELLRAITEPAGLAYELKGRVVSVKPGKVKAKE